jgi:hypothetical protein
LPFGSRGRIRENKAQTVLELMEIANKLTDREDAYNNKRKCSPEVDRASRQRRRSRNENSHTRRNQIAAGYERRNKEGNKNREYRENNSWEREKPEYSGPSQRTCSMGAAISTTHTWMQREFPIIR